MITVATVSIAALADMWWMLRHRAALETAPRPRQVGLVMDGNRRWARAAGHVNPSVGHKYGAEHLEDFLRWSDAWGIEHLMVYVLSADNIEKRSSEEVSYLSELLATTIPDVVTRPDFSWSLHISGDESLIPEATRLELDRARAATVGRPSHLTLAIGYDGRRDIVAAIRQSLNGSTAPTERDITDALTGGPVKDVDLVIRTSGEQRLSGFFPWQCAHADIFTSTKMWPAFTEVDFARALAFYASRRSGSASVGA